MSTIRPFFVIGNKRSGTSFLTRVLNSHEKIFLSHETDIIWILYQFHKNITPIKGHTLDGVLGFNHTMEKYKTELKRDSTPFENYLNIQHKIMIDGSPWLQPFDKQLNWIGDKKPVQNMQPDVFQFITDNFPESRFIHIIRNPFDFMHSFRKDTKNSKTTWGTLKYWAENELRVISLKESGYPIHTVKYKDLCNNMQESCDAIYNFLGEDIVQNITEHIEPIKYMSYASKPWFIPGSVRKVLGHYNDDI